MSRSLFKALILSVVVAFGLIDIIGTVNGWGFFIVFNLAFFCVWLGGLIKRMWEIFKKID